MSANSNSSGFGSGQESFVVCSPVSQHLIQESRPLCDLVNQMHDQAHRIGHLNTVDASHESDQLIATANRVLTYVTNVMEFFDGQVRTTFFVFPSLMHCFSSH